MLIQKAGEELLGSGLGGGMGGSPDFLAVPLETHPIRRIALIDGSHDAAGMLEPKCPTDHRTSEVNELVSSRYRSGHASSMIRSSAARSATHQPHQVVRERCKGRGQRLAVADHCGQEEVCGLEWSQVSIQRREVRLTKTKTSRAFSRCYENRSPAPRVYAAASTGFGAASLGWIETT